MGKIFIFIFLFVIYHSPAQIAEARTPERRCKKILKKDFKNILVEDFVSVVNNDTIIYNEVKFECVFSALYMKKIMYDKFGKWNKEIYPAKNRSPILLWENIRLIENDSTRYTVAAAGLENAVTIYTSALIFDREGNDLLASTSAKKEKLIQYLGNLIRTRSENKSDFYEVYWTAVDPARWQQIKKFRLIK